MLQPQSKESDKMLTLGPLKDKQEIKDLFTNRNLQCNDNSGCVVCKNGDELLGLCLYDLTNEKMVVRHIEPMEDLGLADGILRSTLHVAAERSIMNAFYADTVPEEFFQKLQFIKDSDEKSLNIDKLFQSCCSCGN